MSGLGLGLGLGLSRVRGVGAKYATFTFTSTGTGADTGTLSLFYPASEDGKIVKATGNVKLGAGGDSTEQEIIGGTTNTFIVTCLSGTGTLVLPNTYTRFSANTSDTYPTNGWSTSANSPSLAFDIATLPSGLITFRCEGLNTIGGNLPVDWKSMKDFRCEGSNTVSGDLPADWKSMTSFYCTGANTIGGKLPSDWKSMTYFNCYGSNTIGGNLPADWKSMKDFRCEGSNTVSGDLPADWKSMMVFICLGSNTIGGNLPSDWKSMTCFNCQGSNTIGGNLPSDWKSLTYFNCMGSNTIGGNLPSDWKSLTYLYCTGSNTVSGITEGAYAGNGNMNRLQLISDNNSGGLSAEEQEFLLKGKASRTWSGDRRFNLASAAAAMASMADTNIPGRWFSAAGVPTEVAVALKTLAKVKNVTVVLKGLTMPGTSGDGGGFPAGFGDWWRS